MVDKTPAGGEFFLTPAFFHDIMPVGERRNDGGKEQIHGKERCI